MWAQRSLLHKISNSYPLLPPLNSWNPCQMSFWGFTPDCLLPGVHLPKWPLLFCLQAPLGPVFSFPVPGSPTMLFHSKPDCRAVGISLTPAFCSFQRISHSLFLRFSPSNNKTFVGIKNRTLLVLELLKKALRFEFVWKWLIREVLPRKSTEGVGKAEQGRTTSQMEVQF